MNILSTFVEGEDLHVMTDFALMPEFVYPRDRFTSRRDLLREMTRKAEEITIRQTAKAQRREAINRELSTTTEVR